MYNGANNGTYPQGTYEDLSRITFLKDAIMLDIQILNDSLYYELFSPLKKKLGNLRIRRNHRAHFQYRPEFCTLNGKTEKNFKKGM